MSASFNQRQSGIANTPGNRDIFGVGVPNPGVSVGPGQRIPFGGPNLSYVEWNAGPSGTRVMPRIGFESDGLPRGQRTVREFMSNTFVQQQYVTNKWRNQSELAMIEGQLVFAHRSTQTIKLPGKHAERFGKKNLNSYTLINLPHLNGLLHRAWVSLNSAADSFRPNGQNGKRVAQAYRLRELMRIFSEDEIANYVRFKTDPEFASRFNWPGTDESIAPAEMEELYQLTMEGNFRYAVCPQLALSEYTFMGAIQNLSRGTSMEGINNPSRRDDMLITNVVAAKKAKVHNVFEPYTEVDSGSKLFFIITRKRLADNRPGSLVVQPIACKHNDAPTLAHRYYRDLSGYLCTGLVRAIGYVQLPGTRYPNAIRQQVANGVRPPVNFEQPKRATAILPDIQIQIDMNV